MKIRSKKTKTKTKTEPKEDTGFLAGKRVKSKATAKSFAGKNTKSFSTKKIG